MSERLNFIAAIFFLPRQSKILKLENAMKSSESHKSHIAEYQARKTALKSITEPIS